ncbi:MAG: AraC family transcriptional regulator [Muribaculaceae bacterium]|nr:AraC family transcriptional regulator [Muribaculaceae bacterium]
MITIKQPEKLSEVIDILRQGAAYFTTAASDYHVCRFDVSSQEFAALEAKEPIAIHGLALTLLRHGEIEVELNTDVHTLSSGTLWVTDSRTVQKIRAIKSQDAVIYMLILTQEFLKNLNIDINVLSHARLRTTSDFMIMKNIKEVNIIAGYLDMLNENAVNNPPNSLYTKNISRSLMAALIYQLMQIADRNYVSDVSNRMTSGKTESGSRRMNYVKAFMELIHEHYATERSLSFYADKLCISPKYLSTIIKESTSRSAAEWIDEYVMIEAKNMLKFSGMNIQQVAYALNFRNQSAFGKYFKHLAGMSPSQFQKS